MKSVTRLAQPITSGEHRHDGFEQKLGARVLENQPAHTELNRRQELRALDPRAQEHRAHPFAMVLELPDRFETRQARHREIEQQQVGLARVHHANCFFAGCGFADHLKPGTDIDAIHVLNSRGCNGEQLTKARSEDAMAVCKHHACGCCAVKHWADNALPKNCPLHEQIARPLQTNTHTARISVTNRRMRARHAFVCCSQRVVRHDGNR